MNARRAASGRTRERFLVLGLYALIALVAPLLHHDFDCELKSKIHCDACVAATGIARIEPAMKLAPLTVEVAASTPESVRATSDGAELRVPGRAPPRGGFMV